MNKFFLLLLVGALGVTAFLLTQPVPPAQTPAVSRTAPVQSEPVQAEPVAPTAVVEVEKTTPEKEPAKVETPMADAGEMAAETAAEGASPVPPIGEPDLPMMDTPIEQTPQPIGDSEAPTFRPPELDALTTVAPTTPIEMPAMPAEPTQPAPAWPEEPLQAPAGIDDGVEALPQTAPGVGSD